MSLVEENSVLKQTCAHMNTWFNKDGIAEKWRKDSMFIKCTGIIAYPCTKNVTRPYLTWNLKINSRGITNTGDILMTSG